MALKDKYFYLHCNVFVTGIECFFSTVIVTGIKYFFEKVILIVFKCYFGQATVLVLRYIFYAFCNSLKQCFQPGFRDNPQISTILSI